MNTKEFEIPNNSKGDRGDPWLVNEPDAPVDPSLQVEANLFAAGDGIVEDPEKDPWLKKEPTEVDPDQLNA